MLTRRGLIGAAAGLVGAAAARPDPDFVDQDLTYQLAHNPRAVQIGVEKELIKRGGLRAYTPLAWPACEGSTFMGGWHIDAVLEFMEKPDPRRVPARHHHDAAAAHEAGRGKSVRSHVARPHPAEGSRRRRRNPDASLSFPSRIRSP
ncbi:MAG: hypothetical protein WDN04_13660 [Rhodospirillales bacterium]